MKQQRNALLHDTVTDLWVQITKINRKGDFGKITLKGGGPMVVEDVLLTGSEVAQRLRISKTKVYWLLQRGEIPSIRMGHSIRIRQKDVEEYIRRCLQNPFSKMH